MDLAAHLATIDLLRARAFPAQRGRSGTVDSGPGFHIADLHVSEDFWEDDGTRRHEVLDDFEAECQALVTLLSQRWGEPEVIDLGDHIERSLEGERVMPPLDVLCGYVPEVYAWRVDGRWIALGLGQGSRELPFQLIAAIGEPDVR